MIGSYKKDRYGWTISEILVGGDNACMEQIDAELARYDHKYQKEQSLADKEQYAAAEQKSKPTPLRERGSVITDAIHILRIVATAPRDYLYASYKKGLTISGKPLFHLAPRDGLEPPT